MNCSPRHHQRAFTWVEAIVCFCIIVILIALAVPSMERPMRRGTMTQSLSNMKQLHLATTQMALDGTTTRYTNLGWPGDTGGTFTNWTTQLTTNGYLSINDLCKLLSAPGKIVPSGKLPQRMSDTALIIYTVREESSGDTVFLTTANFTNSPNGGTNLAAKAVPFGNKGFVAFRKAGDGAILQSRQTGTAFTNIIGSYTPPLK